MELRGRRYSPDPRTEAVQPFLNAAELRSTSVARPRYAGLRDEAPLPVITPICSGGVYEIHCQHSFRDAAAYRLRRSPVSPFLK